MANNEFISLIIQWLHSISETAHISTVLSNLIFVQSVWNARKLKEVPPWLKINYPIVLNPIMFIPFILTPMVLVTVAYFSTKLGLVPPATVMPPWVTPPIIGGFLATSSISGGVLAAVDLLLSVLIYMPFVKISVDAEAKKAEQQ